MKSIYWGLIFVLSFLFYFNSSEFDDRYSRPINGDAKGYYAYLPAIIIYQDSDYKFINEIEKKYYPEDLSQAKDFKNKQKNGKYVNKCFPGLSLLYLPFFVIASIIAWLGHFPLDGYSLPYQLAISFSHFFYFFWGIFLLQKFLKNLNLSNFSIQFSLLAFIFGTNCWYYLIYDHTVSHIFNFFITSIFLILLQKWILTQKTKWVGLICVVLAFQLIIRPTGLMNVLFIPLIFNLLNFKLKSINLHQFKFVQLIPFLFLSFAILSIAPLLWKWQSDLWLVYSYNNETFDFLNPQWWNFMFSFKKGWLLWNPLILISIILTSWYLWKSNKKTLLYYIIPILITTYVFSSWWCWTFGMGFGSRVMIDFYPYIIIGLAFFLNRIENKKIIFFAFIPFILLNLIQNYQVSNSILVGGSTTYQDYTTHFLQLKTDAPKVKKSKHWKLIQSKELKLNEKISINKPYSSGVTSDSLASISKAIIKVTIGGQHKDHYLRIVFANSSGSLYQTIYLYNDLYTTPREMEYQITLPHSYIKEKYSMYIWNGDTDAEAILKFLKIELYK